MRTLSLSNVVEAMLDVLIVIHLKITPRRTLLLTVYRRPIVPLYYIEDCRILVQIRSIKGVLTYNIYELYLEAAQAGAGTA